MMTHGSRSPQAIVTSVRSVGVLGMLLVAPAALAQPMPYAQPTTPYAQPLAPYVVGSAFGVGSWALPAHEERRATIVSGLPMTRRYRVCNASNTTAVVATDAQPGGFDLPGRSCADLAARTITITQRAAGIAPFGTYAELPIP
jgi:hypothetical protein